METLKQWVHHKTELANAGSIMIKTRVGDVQYTDMGKGIPVIHSHGSPAGCDAGPRAFGKLANEGGLRFIIPSLFNLSMGGIFPLRIHAPISSMGK